MEDEGTTERQMQNNIVPESQYKMPILLMILVRNETEWMQLTRNIFI